MDWVAKSKLIIFSACLFPLVWTVYAAVSNQLGPDPGNELTRTLGEWSLRFLCLTLCITPLRKMTGVNKLIRYRRMIGLFSLFYAVCHVMAYLAFMLGWQWQTLVDDLVQRPYIIVGAIALVILLLLGATSTKGMMRRLGRLWFRFHKLVYLAAALVLVHFFWLVRSDYTEPFAYGAVLAVLALLRLKGWLNKQKS